MVGSRVCRPQAGSGELQVRYFGLGASHPPTSPALGRFRYKLYAISTARFVSGRARGHVSAMLPVSASLVIGLLLNFLSFGAYMYCSPYKSPSDDKLSQICQLPLRILHDLRTGSDLQSRGLSVRREMGGECRRADSPCSLRSTPL